LTKSGASTKLITLVSPPPSLFIFAEGSPLSRPAEIRPEKRADENDGRAPRGSEQKASDTSVEELVQRIADVFGRRLDCASLGPDDDFFQRGGSSFLAALCTAELRKQGITLAIQDIFVASTPQSLALRIQPLQKAQ